ncbi:MAG: hypothetical protein HVK27_04130 [Pelagibacteraceae bacterium]|nr:hypothetical protein [Pelagibacteraceae bacterium]
MKRINIDTGKEYLRGDKPTKEDLPKKKGKIFYIYRPHNKILSNGYFGEEWVTEKKLKLIKEKHKERTKRKGIKEKNPKTGKIWERGQICKSRGYFWEYQRQVRNDGTFQTTFYKTFKKYHEHRIKTIFMKRRIYARENKLPFNISAKYLIEIFPKDFKCPVLGIEMKWTQLRNGQNNPSLDRKKPEKGYVKGNAVWISYRANQIKNDSTIEELEKILNYSKKI